MAGEGFALAREELVRTLTAYSGVTTADGSSNKNTLIDSALIGKNDFLKGKSVLIMSGDAQYETTGISNFDSTTGEITFATALSAQIVAGVSFRILNVLPESVHISSGQVQIMGWDYESGEWRKVRVTGSGEIAIHVTVADIVTAKISGQSVIVTSGQVQIMGWDYESGESRKVRVTGSGEIAIHVTVADIVTAKISGQSVVVTSGQVVAKVSGEAVKISGEIVTAKVSGETVQTAAPSTIRAGYSMITSQSGGTELYSGVVVIAKVRNLPGNDNMWLGPTGVLSGTGHLLQGGELDEFEIDNLNAIYLHAQTSGQYVCYRGVN